jgi:type II secretory pathway pseudopilin PulG
MQHKGFSTVEILIAMAFAVLVITAVAPSAFGNQSSVIGGETHAEALRFAQEVLETAQAMAREDYASVDSYAPAAVGSYTRTLTTPFALLTECQKEVKSTVEWAGEYGQPLSVELSSLVTDIAEMIARGGDCDTTPPGDWDNPHTAVSIGLGGVGGTDIDVDKNFLYLTSDPSAAAKSDFYIYEFNPSALTLTARGDLDIGDGLAAVDKAGEYAYVASVEDTNQLQVIDVSDPALPFVAVTASLPNITNGNGLSITHYAGRVYVGTDYVACPPSCPSSQNNELHVYDVSTPSAPLWLGSANVNHNVNAIVVRGDYAYLATSGDSSEVMVYDVSDPTSITLEYSFNATGTEDGLSLALVGNRLYLGRERAPAGRSDFYILDVSNPVLPSVLGEKNLGLNPNSDIVGVVVRGPFAFLAIDNPTTGLAILNITNPSAITHHTVCTTLNFSENTTAIDMEGDYIFTANTSNDEIRVLRDQPSSC